MAAEFVSRLGRSVIKVHGEHTNTFLRGLTTNWPADVDSFYTSFLTPQGRVLAESFVMRTGPEEVFLDIDDSYNDTMIKWISRFKLRSRVEIKLKPGMRVYQASQHFGLYIHDERIPENDTEVLGYRIFYDGESPETYGKYTELRYKLGVPEGIKEIIPGEALPLESNLDILGAIDFRKGCYTGQELTIRTHHTGVVRKRIVPLTGEFGNGIEGGQIHLLDNQNASELRRRREKGRFFRGIGNFGLGLLRLENVNQQLTVMLEDGIDQPELPVHAHIPTWWAIRGIKQ